MTEIFKKNPFTFLSTQNRDVLGKIKNNTIL